MPFINKHTDSFLPSNHPWDQDAQQVYNYRKEKPVEINLKALSYDQLKQMLGDMASIYNPMPDCPKKREMQHKMKLIAQEMQIRDDFKNVARKERDDPFEKQPQEETLKYKKEVYFKSPKQNDVQPEETQDPVVEEEDCDIEEVEYPGEIDYTMSQRNLNNFLIASLIVITLISIMGGKKNRKNK